MNPKVSVAGSVLVIVGGLLTLLVGAVVSYVFHSLFSAVHIGSTALTSFLFLGPVLGLVLVIVGILALVLPSINIVWGILAIIFGVLSLFTTALGGVFLGFILVLIGGILIAVKRAPPPAPMAPYGTQPYGTPPYGAPPPPQ
jgi:hypothetical protein